jgi:hypothetical protein
MDLSFVCLMPKCLYLPLPYMLDTWTYLVTFFHYHEVMSNAWLMGDKWMGEGNVMAVLFRLFKSQKVAYSIPDLVFANITDIILPNTMALGST